MPPPASTAPSRVLADLAKAKGVATEYDDWRGGNVIVPASTIVAVLRALGIDASDDAAAARALAAGGGPALAPPAATGGRVPRGVDSVGAGAPAAR